MEIKWRVRRFSFYFRGEDNFKCEIKFVCVSVTSIMEGDEDDKYYGRRNVDIMGEYRKEFEMCFLGWLVIVFFICLNKYLFF